jgi:hypothetical protein
MASLPLDRDLGGLDPHDDPSLLEDFLGGGLGRFELCVLGHLASNHDLKHLASPSFRQPECILGRIRRQGV